MITTSEDSLCLPGPFPPCREYVFSDAFTPITVPATVSPLAEIELTWNASPPIKEGYVGLLYGNLSQRFQGGTNGFFVFGTVGGSGEFLVTTGSAHLIADAYLWTVPIRFTVTLVDLGSVSVR